MDATQISDEFARRVFLEAEDGMTSLRARLCSAPKEGAGANLRTVEYVKDVERWLAHLKNHLENQAAIAARKLAEDEPEHVRPIKAAEGRTDA